MWKKYFKNMLCENGLFIVTFWFPKSLKEVLQIIPLLKLLTTPNTDFRYSLFDHGIMTIYVRFTIFF